MFLCSYVLIRRQLFDVVYREETLLNVIRSVTRNGWSIVLTAALALILVYLFSIIGYTFFKNDFVVDVSDNNIDWETIQLHINERVEQYVHMSIASGESNRMRPTEMDACEIGADCVQKDEPIALSNVVESITKEVMAEVEESKEEACSTLIMCIVTTLNHGLRSGGGIGDILRPPSNKVRSCLANLIIYIVIYVIPRSQRGDYVVVNREL
ncbi:Inositol 1,4,5-trisphosphate receptor type 1 [Chionoecetes opilio]|uniref:Inositol 1,4,5-trisphosphate receptor type 1 n=1 Tax=Chionoecetes opilio TaxID=41210 RepID=A0A8J4XWV6_CHIOP|nr:Inositol 1,4,5-trisphosphate receptor type 1 [Chionoecetes opilio]